MGFESVLYFYTLSARFFIFFRNPYKISFYGLFNQASSVTQ